MLDYQKIFDQRGHSYRLAMDKYPLARRAEFIAALDYVRPYSGMTLLDIPSGGGYLKDYLDEDVDYLGYDFSGEFADNHAGVSKCREAKLVLNSNSVDVVLSLAAHHHIVDRKGFYDEIYRVLSPKGKFIIIDIEAGSKVDTFLNDFVNRWNTHGHQGIFLSQNDIRVLTSFGYEVNYHNQTIQWVFDNTNEMVSFVRLLFGLDMNPTTSQVMRALNELGFEKVNNMIALSWPMAYLECIKK